MIEVRVAPPEHYAWIELRAGVRASEGFKAIEATEDGRVLGMVGHDGWTPNSCSIHVAIDDWRALRRLLRPGFSAAYCDGRGVALASVLSTNTRSRALVKKLGFRPLTVIMDGWERGVNLHIYEMRRETCRWLR